MRSQVDSPQGTNMVAPKWEDRGKRRPWRQEGGEKGKSTSSRSACEPHSLELRETHARRGPANGVLRVPRRGVLRGPSSYLPVQRAERAREGGRYGGGRVRRF